MNQLLLASCFSFVCKEDPALVGKREDLLLVSKRMELTEPTMKKSEQTRGKVKNFVLCWLGWFAFLSATTSFALSAHRYLTGGFLGSTTETLLCIIFALFYTVWWFLVIKR
ncbi:hypothetical protein KJ751_03535 [Patescibacteria group bacterium]|nr:hypothetical protein [Patescibacteria group bacterium]